VTASTIYDVTPDFGALYDEVPAYASRRDVEFYLSEAERRVGPTGTVLDLGCGTGRLLFPLARAGHRVVGVDGSPAMLARCRERLAHESPDIRPRVSLHESDIRDFDVQSPGGFAIAIAPFRILQHMITADDQLRCLAAVRRHLAPGGCFAFDVFNPSFRLMVADRSAESEDTAERQLPDGRFFRRTVRVLRVRWVEQVSEVELIYYLRTGDSVDRRVQAFEMRWYTASELEHLLARAGFAVNAVYGHFDRGPLDDASPEMVIVATRG
jgi:SAM-dependent methyltransferase